MPIFNYEQPGRALPSCPLRIVPSRVSRYCRIVYGLASYTTALGTSSVHVLLVPSHIYYQALDYHGRHRYQRRQCGKASCC